MSKSMGCLGYFVKRRKELRMPRNDSGVDELGIRSNGDVLTGKKSVDLALGQADMQAFAGSNPRRFGQRLELDPVLRAHIEGKFKQQEEEEKG